MTIAPFAKTLLGIVVLCAALLIGFGYALDPGPLHPEPLGLTAGAVLASDGMTPDGTPNGLAGRAPRRGLTHK